MNNFFVTSFRLSDILKYRRERLVTLFTLSYYMKMDFVTLLKMPIPDLNQIYEIFVQIKEKEKSDSENSIELLN